MYPNELIPDSIFDHEHCAIVYAFLLRCLSPITRRVLVDGKVLEIRPNQALIRRPLDARLRLSELDVLEALRLLERLNELCVRETKSGYFVELVKIPVHQILDVAETGEVADGALPEITFRVFAESYLKHVRENDAPKTLDNAKRVMKHAIQRFGEKLLSKLGPQDLEEFKQWRLEELRKAKGNGAGVTTTNIDVRTLKAALERALDLGYLHKNPFRRVRQIHQQKLLPVFVQKNEFTDLLNLVESDGMKRIFTFAALTGMRRGEILSLQWKDIHFELKTIDVQSSVTYRVKHGKNRIIPMSDAAEHLLRSLERQDPFVFMTPDGRPFSADFVTKTFKKAVRALGLDDRLKFHSLRATCASWLAHESVPPFHIKELLGHAYLKTTEAYTRIPTSELRDAVEKLTLQPTAGRRTRQARGATEKEGIRRRRSELVRPEMRMAAG